MSMDYRKTKKIFIFIDESGDVGDPLVHQSSSRHFTINIGVATEQGVEDMEHLIAGFKFFNNHKKELKKIDGENLKNLTEKIPYLSDVQFYEMTIDKMRYTGPYLKDGRYQRNPLWFRNFILKKALEYISVEESLFAFGKPIELIIDRYAENKKDSDNLRTYLTENTLSRTRKDVFSRRFQINLPKILPAHVVQVDSRYCLPIQLLDIIQRAKCVCDMSRLCVSIPAASLQSERGPDVL